MVLSVDLLCRYITVVLAIVGNRYNMFSIEKLSGEIKVSSPIEQAGIGYYKLEIGVHDNGLPPHTVFTLVIIRVTKVCLSYVSFPSMFKASYKSYSYELSPSVLVSELSSFFLHSVLDVILSVSYWAEPVRLKQYAKTC